ncbi:MAG TPA: hypothetical protein VEK08_18600 [Planctomycetota bacterium]|nr:hypothetical protein [Planctomycetota bacterium]
MSDAQTEHKEQLFNAIGGHLISCAKLLAEYEGAAFWAKNAEPYTILKKFQKRIDLRAIAALPLVQSELGPQKPDAPKESAKEIE